MADTLTQGYTAFQRQIAREALAEHDNGCCTAEARCDLGGRLEHVAAHGRLAQDVHPDADRTMPRGNGNGRSSFTPRTPVATEAQMNFINSLLSRLDAAAEGTPAAIARDMARIDLADKLARRTSMDKRTASRVIDYLKPLADALPRPVRTPAPRPASTPAVTEGMYEMDGSVYRVKLSKAGRLYAMLLVPETGKGSFEYAPGIVNRLRPEHRMTLDRAVELSALFHFCVRCGRELTKASSIAQSMGDICASKI